MDSDILNMIDLSEFERDLSAKGFKAVCGVDECGRGPLAGPVVAAAVIMPPDVVIDNLNDSKKLSAPVREQVFERIAELGLICAVGIVDHKAIDRMNIHRASLAAMARAVMELKQAPDFCLIDGQFNVPNLNFPQMAVVHGDSLCRAIAAASVVAKVTRDRIMERYEAMYPMFSFATHKGYTTPEHLQELEKHGPCDIHRRSYRPVAKLLYECNLF